MGSILILSFYAVFNKSELFFDRESREPIDFILILAFIAEIASFVSSERNIEYGQSVQPALYESHLIRTYQ